MITKNNLLSKENEFYYFDGSPYLGEYHLHGDGQAMTGSSHSDESIFIFRKDRKGKLHNPRQNMSNHKKRALKKYRRLIPTPHREFTESDEKIARKVASRTADNKMQRAIISSRAVSRAKKLADIRSTVWQDRT